MLTFRLFVSSPGDVMIERRRVENVASRLNGEFAGGARLEALRWETKYYQAFSTFQKQIPRSTDCDLVVGILKWRLGTELPPDFAEKLPDGRPFPSGTAYEILTAVEKRQQGAELPDVYVFRFADQSGPRVALDDPKRPDTEREWGALKAFFAEWFLTPQGHFKAAFNSYVSEDDFEAQLEKLLRQWMADKVAGGRAARWPIEVKGSPFCALDPFGVKHAPVFFGRSRDIGRAVDLWREAGSRNSPYLLVIGASGAGKSSLARAGLIPRLTTPGVVREVDAWRVAVMRPSDSATGPFSALATAVMQDSESLPKEEEGRGPALPEIGQGDSRTPAEFSRLLQHADGTAVKPILNALARVETMERERERYERPVRCDLVLLIDQLDELFAASVSEAERKTFVQLLSALVETGRIWLCTTLRADFYARMLEQPGLKKLKELGVTYDLAPPGPVELAEIVRGPAEAAGLVFETDPASGERLDQRLLREADQPDMLPLVQLALSRLFEGREKNGGEIRLSLKTYEGLGGLKGIINEAGEKALASVGEAEEAQLPRLLRQLAVPANAEAALTISSVPRAQAEPDEASRKLVEVLVKARLLTTSGTEAEQQVRLAHQRVLEDWTRARRLVTQSADFFRIRADVEESRRRWDAGNRRRELLLPRGLPLAEAESVIAQYRDELDPQTLAYVGASRRRANRGQVIAWSAAAAFFLVALGAGIASKIAFDQRTAAVAAQNDAENQRATADVLRELGSSALQETLYDFTEAIQYQRPIAGDLLTRLHDRLQKASAELEQAASAITIVSFNGISFKAPPDACDPHTIDAEPYLKQFGISVEKRSPAKSKIVLAPNSAIYEATALRPTVSDNFLMQICTDNVPASYTLRFAKPVISVSFMRPGIATPTKNGTSFPLWTATALSETGEDIASVSEGHLLRVFNENEPAAEARTYTLRGPARYTPISGIRIDSNPILNGRPFAAFSALVIEQLAFVR